MCLEQMGYGIGLSLIAGISTGIGGLMVLLFRKTNVRLLSVILGFSAGIMIYISFIEIYQEAQTQLCKIHGEISGKIMTVLAFFFGITLVAMINELIPEADHPHRTRKIEDTQKVPFHTPNSTLRSGRLLRTGIFTALAVTVHNFPEGMATFISSVKNPALGLSIALAIAIHNIPEGISISIPVYYATKSRKKAFLMSLFSGLSEPLGAILTMVILGPYISETLFGLVFGAVAGIMVYISLDELLPTAREYGEHHLAFLGFMLGMVIMALSVILIF